MVQITLCLGHGPTFFAVCLPFLHLFCRFKITQGTGESDFLGHFNLFPTLTREMDGLAYRSDD